MAIVRAVGIAVGRATSPSDALSNQRIQDAMLAAVQTAQAEGVNDDDVVRERIAAAVQKQQRIEEAVMAAVQEALAAGIRDDVLLATIAQSARAKAEAE